MAIVLPAGKISSRIANLEPHSMVILQADFNHGLADHLAVIN